MPTAIRPITLLDAGGYRACLDAVARERRWISLVEAPPMDRVQDWIQAALNDDCPFVVVVDSGRIVGWCDVIRHTKPDERHIGLLGVGLLPEYRDQGLGNRLIRATLAGARIARFERVELEVLSTNERARHLYEKIGFTVEGVRRRAFKRDGFYDDVVLMAVLFGKD